MAEENEKHALTVGELIAFIERHHIGNDAPVMIEREAVHDDERWFDHCPAATVEISTNGYVRLNLLIGG